MPERRSGAARVQRLSTCERGRRWLVLAILMLLGFGPLALDSPAASAKAVRVLVVGGGAEHDYGRWIQQEDVATLKFLEGVQVSYTDQAEVLQAALKALDVLVLSNSQPFSHESLQQAILEFAASGKGLIILHAAIWHNWEDWPDFNRVLVGGGARSRGEFGPFEVAVLEEKHPVMAKVPGSFKISDELYRFEPMSGATSIEALASGEEPTSGKIYPVVWIVKHPKARIVGISLGHDGPAHQSEAYRIILRNSLRWVARLK